MKNKIAGKLMQYSAFVLLLFAVLSGVLFSAMFKKHTVDVTMRDQRAHIASIADTLSHFMANYIDGSCRGVGFKSYTRFVGDLSMGDLYLIDGQGEAVTVGEMALPDALLPGAAKALAARVFETGEITGESLSAGLFHADSLMTAAPVLDASGNVLYAVVIHYPVDIVEHTLKDTAYILVASLALAVALAFAVSTALSRRFVRPLYSMMDTTTKLTGGDYSAKTCVIQNDEIGVLAAHIDALAERLEEAEKERSRFDQLRQDFFSDVSHELRTPISVLKGSVELLRDGMIKEPQQMRRYYEQLYMDANHLERLVCDLLELTRLQNPQFAMQMDVVNLMDVLGDTVRFMRQRAEKKRISIRLEGGAPFAVWGDYGRMRQMMIILLDNAVKFSPEGGEVFITARRLPEACEVSVTDHGCGMDQETLEHIFDRYYHSHSARNKGGTGLGLPIAREIALRHSTQLTCSSAPGEGARFSVLFAEHHVEA